MFLPLGLRSVRCHSGKLLMVLVPDPHFNIPLVILEVWQHAFADDTSSARGIFGLQFILSASARLGGSSPRHEA